VFHGCNAELEECSGICHLLSSGDRCGSCNTKCGAAQVCSLRQCRDSCLPNLTACSGGCVDLTSDPYNCGTCGKTCTQNCIDGECKASCPTGWGSCVAGCRALDRDPLNCGLCGNECEPGMACVRGVCQRI
jgi:hypothetical protein